MHFEHLKLEVRDRALPILQKVWIMIILYFLLASYMLIRAVAALIDDAPPIFWICSIFVENRCNFLTVS